MRALLLDVTQDKVMIIETNGMQDYYKLIRFNTIDIINRGINGKRFDIICDDEGLFKNSPQISAISRKRQALLVGNLIIAGEADGEGNLTDLSDADIKHSISSINKISTRLYPNGYFMVCNLEY